MLESGLLLVIGTYAHYRYARVGSLQISTAGDWTGPTEMFRSNVRS